MWPTLPWIVAAALGRYTAGEVMRCRHRAPSVSGRCRVPDASGPRVVSPGYAGDGQVGSVLRNAWPSRSMMRPTRASKPEWLSSRLVAYRHRPRAELQPAHELQVDTL